MGLPSDKVNHGPILRAREVFIKIILPIHQQYSQSSLRSKTRRPSGEYEYPSALIIPIPRHPRKHTCAISLCDDRSPSSCHTATSNGPLAHPTQRGALFASAYDLRPSANSSCRKTSSITRRAFRFTFSNPPSRPHPPGFACRQAVVRTWRPTGSACSSASARCSPRPTRPSR